VEPEPSLESAILFREIVVDEKEGTWGYLGDDIPGFDHVALTCPFFQGHS